MNEIERAIKYFNGYGSPYDNLVIKALEEKAERENMRCENCKQCLANKVELYCGLVYDCLENGEVESTDFCSDFEPKDKE